MRAIFSLSIVSLLVSTLSVAEPSAAYLKAHAVPFTALNEVPASLAPELGKFKAIAVGEIHGSEETPRFVAGLLRHFVSRGKAVLLGLEIPPSEQPALDRYLATGDLAVLKDSPFFRRDYQDGRSSRAMARLLGDARALAGVRVFGFDADTSVDGQDRDEKMAKNLAAAYRQKPTDVVVFLAGNIHASLARGTHFDPKYRPMGYELLHADKPVFKGEEILAIKVLNETGETWCCLGPSKADCSTHPMIFGKTPYSEALPDDLYFVKEPSLYEGYGASFFIRKLTTSLPLGY